MKKSIIKRILSLFLCAMLCMSLLPAAAFAENEVAETEPIAAELPEKAVLLPEETIPAEEPAAENPAPAEPVNDSQSPAPLADDAGVSIDETNFPDAKFREYVSGSFDSDSDGFLSQEEAESVTAMTCEDRGLTSLEGLSFFPNLTSLYCFSNQLTGLDVSGNPALQSIDCSFNQIAALDVSGNPALQYLTCTENQLTGLDVSGNPALKGLGCNSNQLTELDVSSNTELAELYCANNQLTQLDISHNKKLIRLYCENNQISALAVNGYTALEELYCFSNQLTELDAGNNTALRWLSCHSNQLTEVNVSGDSSLTEFNCGGNQLTALDVSSNTALSSLGCESNQLSQLDLSQNAALVMLDCGSNQLTALDVSGNTALQNLGCTFNGLSTLDVSGLTALAMLDCTSNQLTALNVSGCTALKTLNCFFNQLTALDVSGLTALETLNCGANQLTELNMSGCTALKTLGCVSNQLTELDVSGFPYLDFLYCTSNQLSGLDLRQNTILRGLYCEDNRLTALDLGENSNLQWVTCSGQTVSVPSFTQSGEKYLFDLSTLVGAENTGRVSSVETADYDAETGIASFDAPGSFTYNYSTGYGETLMDVTCEYDGSPVPDENGDYHISSFAELKALAAQEYTEWTNVFYEGTETFVFEEDLTLPVNLSFSSSADIRVPSGVTVTANAFFACSNNTLYVEGTLIAYDGIDLRHINVSGSLQSYAYISIPSTGEITGEENVVFYPSEQYPKGGFHISYSVNDYDAFLGAVQEANANLPNRFYDISLMSETTTTIDREISLGDNASLGVNSPLVIAENGALNFSYWMTVFAPVTINGSMDNAGRIVIYHWAEPSASLTLGETGSYSGTGEITIYSDTLTSPDEAVPGFALSDFDIADNGRGWTLRYAAGLEKLATPVDLRVGIDYVYNYDENGNFTGYKAVEAPGVISWRVEGLTQNQFNICIYKAGEETPVWHMEWTFGGDERSAFAISDFIRMDPESGEYYFTVTALGDSTQYRNSDTAVSETWTYVKPELSLGQCSKPVLDGKDVSFLFPEDLSYVGGEIMEIYYSPSADMADAMIVGEISFIDNEAVSQREGSSYIYDYAIQYGGAGYYSVRVRALSCDINAACNGPWSEMSDPVYIADVASEVDAILQGIEEGTVAPTAETVREQVQELDTEALRMAMLADNDDSGVNSSLQALEAYTGGTVVEVTDAMTGNFNAATVGVIGASLNNVQDSGQPVKLIVDQAKEDDVIPELYDNTVAVKFSLGLENVDSTQLEVPVKVTLPVPAGINPDFLVILHYHVSGEAPEEIQPYVFQQDGQTYASFVLTSFSDFVMTVPATEERLPGDTNGDGSVNTMDLIRLMKHINGEEVDMAEGAGDVNGDGKVNTMDLIRLMKYINGEDVELL